MTPDLDRIRTTHAVAIANRQRGSFDSRDDDIGALIAEVERLRASEVCHSATIEALQPDAERWRYVRENGPSCLYWGSELFGDYDNVTGDEADAAVDAARKAT